MEFAIVDIETTGGYASGHGITEVAILIHDGIGVREQFSSLVNPGQSIPPAIQALTGIDDRMVSAMPSFQELAPGIAQLLEGRVFVAHNVNFDYSFIKHHMEQAGYPFHADRLCTVRLSRKIWPGLPSYSLDKLCRSLDISIEHRHRAAGDAQATAVLFSRILSLDTRGHVKAMLKRGSREMQLPPHLPKAMFDSLPHQPGVYYFQDQAGKVVYVGKAKDIRQRVSAHFTGQNPYPQRQHFLHDVHVIDYTVCGTELMAFLLESVEIRRLWPTYNRAMKHPEARFGLFCYEDQSGYLRLAIGRMKKNQHPVQVFYSQRSGVDTLHKLARKFALCPELCMLGPCNGPCGVHTGGVPGADRLRDRRPAREYNDRVTEALSHLMLHLPSFAIVDEGRDEEERSCIWVDKGNFYGMGYIGPFNDLKGEQIKETLTPYPGNQYMMQLIYDYAEKYPYKVVQCEMVG